MFYRLRRAYAFLLDSPAYIISVANLGFDGPLVCGGRCRWVCAIETTKIFSRRHRAYAFLFCSPWIRPYMLFLSLIWDKTVSSSAPADAVFGVKHEQ